jgi:hypothetical protein
MSLETTNQGLQKALAALRKQNQQLKQELQIWRNTAMSTQSPLVKYLANLNSADSQWGVWVNPENTDEYRIGQFQFENGGILDNWICIGSLDRLSFGYQSQSDAIAQYLQDENSRIKYKDRYISVSIKGIVEAYSNGNLDDKFQAFLEEEACVIQKFWSEMEAENFVCNELPDLIEEVLKARKEAELIYS